jgi:gluconate kinase
MKQTAIYLLVGVPGSGKSWVADQVGEKFEYVRNDDFMKQKGGYLTALIDRAQSAIKPILCEAPFSISELKDPLERAGHKVIPVFIIENPWVVAERYAKRENKLIPRGHLTRMETYRQRAEQWDSFKGTSSEVLEHLKSI